MEGLKVGRGRTQPGFTTLREISDATDALVCAWFDEDCANEGVDLKAVDGAALLALGGFGRREMTPASDVDLMLLHEGDLPGAVAQAFTKFSHRFYDARLKLGSAVRSFRGALDIGDEDLESQTAMMESRLLEGNMELAERFVGALGRQLRKRSRRYVDRKIVERDERIAAYGATINIQEPNLKESPGGLRDYHQGLWLAGIREGRKMTISLMVRQGYITDRDMRRVEKALDGLFRLRCLLHWIGKGDDLIRMDIQEKLARALGYEDEGERLAEERLMREYYAAASVIRQFADDVTERCRAKPRWRTFLRRSRVRPLGDGFAIRDGELEIPDDLHFFENDPPRCLDLFVHLADTGARLSHNAELAVAENRALIDTHLMQQDRPKKAVRRLLGHANPVAPTFRVMDQLRVLPRVLPEWEHIRSLVRHDLLHRYTVDEHTLLALQYLETLSEGSVGFAEDRQQIYEGLPNRAAMRLLVLGHDIGKGYNRDHSEVGAELTTGMAERLDFSKDAIEDLDFLIRNHLVMSHASQRRDVSDPHVLAEFADFIGSKERLDMLYLLTHVDVTAVRPDMMNPWKSHLLWQLYSGVLRVLEDTSGDRRRPELVMARRVDKTRAGLESRFGKDSLDEHLAKLPRDYVYRHSEEAIAEHLKLIQEFKGEAPVVSFRDHVDPRFQEIIVVTNDRVGLFRRLCLGILMESFSIVNARLNTRSDGIACDDLVISDEVDSPRDREGGRQILRERLCSLLQIEGEVPRLPQRALKREPNRIRYDTQVSVYNELSPLYTVVDIRTVDRPGVLLTMTEVFSELELSIHYANLATEGRRAVDVFYLVESSGSKLTDRSRLESLKQRLHERLGEFMDE